MPTTTPTDSLRAATATPATADFLQERLAEAASYAVLQRIAPALRHDVAGFMQPVGMLVMVLQRRVQMPEPDLQAIAKNVISISALAKEATTGCMNVMDWMASREDACISMYAGVDEVVRLLALELSGHGLSASHDLAADISVDLVQVPRRFFHCVLAGALLAWCDQIPGAGVLRITGWSDASEAELKLQFEADGTALPADAVHRQRRIGWDDAEALARACGATVSRGKGWVRLRLSHSLEEAASKLCHKKTTRRWFFYVVEGGFTSIRPQPAVQQPCPFSPM